LFKKARGISKRIQIGFYLINSFFDATFTDANHMPFKYWKRAYNMLTLIVNTLVKNPEIVLIEYERDLGPFRQALGLEIEIGNLPNNFVHGNLTANLDKLHDELYKALQSTEISTRKYDQRLKHVHEIILLGRFIDQYYSSNGKDSSLVAVKLLEHMYYRLKFVQYDIPPTDEVIVEKDPSQPEEDTSETFLDITSVIIEETDIKPPAVALWETISEGVEYLSDKIYRFGSDHIRGKTILYHIYFLSLNGQFFEARDLLLVSHITHEKIAKANINIQILYNRCIAQLGIAAFRKLRILDTFSFLHDIIFGGKSKELLAQGINRNIEKSPEDEKKRTKKTDSPTYAYQYRIN